jgi:hypothetical protein
VHLGPSLHRYRQPGIDQLSLLANVMVTVHSLPLQESFSTHCYSHGTTFPYMERPLPAQLDVGRPMTCAAISFIASVRPAHADPTKHR